MPAPGGVRRGPRCCLWYEIDLAEKECPQPRFTDERLAIGPHAELISKDADCKIGTAARHRSRCIANTTLNLNALVVFAKVAEANSFSEGARRLRLPVSTVSRQVADLEAQLGVRLLERSTRSLKLTGIGAEILEAARATVHIRQSVLGLISSRLSSVSGHLRKILVLTQHCDISDHASCEGVPILISRC